MLARAGGALVTARRAHPARPLPAAVRRLAGLAPDPGSKHQRIYAVVRTIPRGRVASYGQVARLAGLPGHARLVGYALHALPPFSGLPWHRVVAADGRISLMRSDTGSGTTQRLRLEREGVGFDARGRVTLARHGWHGAPTRRGTHPSEASRARRMIR